MSKPGLSTDILKSREFRLMLYARMFSLSALQAQAVIIGWQIYEATKDPLMLGLTGLVEAVPAISCALFAGYVVDKTSAHKVYKYSLLAMTLNTLFLFIIAGGLFPLATHHFLPLAYTAIFISGLARSFVRPCSSALLSQKVAKRDIPAASAWLNSGFQAASIAAPAIGGFIYGSYGALAAWAMPMLMMAAAFLSIYAIKPPEKDVLAPSGESAIESIREGWKFILKHPILLGSMSIDMLAVLFGGAVALLPAFATDVLNIGSEGLGALRAAPAAGAVIMAFIMALRPMNTIRVSRLLWVVVGFGICMIGFGLSHNFWLSLFCLAMSGVFDSISVVIRQTLVQILTPNHMLGRVSSVSGMFITSSNELGAFESGALAKLIGVVQAVVVGGVGTLVVAAGTALLSPAMRTSVIYAHPEDEKKAA